MEADFALNICLTAKRNDAGRCLISKRIAKIREKPSLIPFPGTGLALLFVEINVQTVRLRDVLGDTLGDSLGSEFLSRNRAIEVAAESAIASGDVIVVQAAISFLTPKFFRPTKITDRLSLRLQESFKLIEKFAKDKREYAKNDLSRQQALLHCVG